MGELLEKTTKMNMLYDFYEPLLTDKQKEYMALYYREDYSLGEIADLRNVSRQAIYDNIKRTEQLLEKYEDKLHLYDKFITRNQLFHQLDETINAKKHSNRSVLQIIEQLKNID